MPAHVGAPLQARLACLACLALGTRALPHALQASRRLAPSRAHIRLGGGDGAGAPPADAVAGGPGGGAGRCGGDGSSGGGGGGGGGGKGGGGSGSDGRPFGSARDWLARNPIALKATSMGATYSLADIAAQLWAFDGGAVPLLDRLRRNLGLSLIGLLWVGPLLSVWFDWLAVICPGAGVRPVLLRTLADQLLEAPFMISSIFFFSALVEGHDVAFAMRKVRAGVVRTWASCSVVWAPVQLVNQGLVPLHLRVYFQAFVSFFWDAYMSVAAHAPVPD
ncbi:hypothetical protein KFE25_006591 [Diacronema lutheri]|uniref:Peroxisomal membrane protein MPV17 n=1 Tax=Diacronema lutheri TaxID=2081491 RepID=A0A8J5X5U4_DIALT|nr:hypothetical protein KFE25_006591 [Diacronema lutheri]